MKLAPIVLALLACAAAHAEDLVLFNGKDLSGWKDPLGTWSVVGGVKLAEHDCGAIYQRWDPARGKGHEGYEGHTPRSNASKPPGEWQSFDITFRAPRFDAAGEKIADAVFVKVVHNGQVIHENVALTGPTRGAKLPAEGALGPIVVQGDHGPVAYRNFTIKPLAAGK